MIDEDFHFEESNPKKVFLACLTILFLLGVGFGAYKYLINKNTLKLEKIQIELGDQIPTEISSYIKKGNYDGYQLDISSIHVDENGLADSVGEYSYKIYNNNETLKGKLIVKDTVAPVVELQELTVGLNEEFDLNDFVTLCEDLSGQCNVYYADYKDEELTKEEGTYEISLIIKDKYNNEVTKKTKLIVSKDASLQDLKASNTEIKEIYPIDEKWDKTYTVKFEKGISEDDKTFESKILELTNRDFESEFDKKIVKQTMITIYNKYNYVLGFSIKLEFEDGEEIYVTS